MPKLVGVLELERCPHCGVSHPNLKLQNNFATYGQGEGYQPERNWIIYTCNRCGGVVTAWAKTLGEEILGFFPTIQQIDGSIPTPASDYLSQALQSLHAPAGAIMLSASAIDAMLKIKGYKDGSLYARIEKAAGDHLITCDMKKWAHEVRLDANDQRHASEAQPLPTEADAKRSVEFALALAQFLFVLPARVQRGLADATDGGERV